MEPDLLLEIATRQAHYLSTSIDDLELIRFEVKSLIQSKMEQVEQLFAVAGIPKQIQEYQEKINSLTVYVHWLWEQRAELPSSFCEENPFVDSDNFWKNGSDLLSAQEEISELTEKIKAHKERLSIHEINRLKDTKLLHNQLKNLLTFL